MFVDYSGSWEMLLENHCSRPPGLLPSAGSSCTSCCVIWTVLFVELLGVSAFKDHLRFSAQVIFKAPGWSYMHLENGALENGNSIAMIIRSRYQRMLPRVLAKLLGNSKSETVYLSALEFTPSQSWGSHWSLGRGLEAGSGSGHVFPGGSSSQLELVTWAAFTFYFSHLRLPQFLL